jgi:curved DNA-binding protein CbpA
MTRYFEKCKTAEELKKAYREHAKRLHPDCGGSAEMFKEMQNQFEKAFSRLKDIHETKDGKTYESREKSTETAGEFMDLINELLKLDGVNVEMCGSWVWCTGETKKHKDRLKELRFQFSAKKAAWYYHREPFIKKSKGSYSMDKIREMYGSTNYGTGKAEENAAALLTA